MALFPKGYGDSFRKQNRYLWPRAASLTAPDNPVAVILVQQMEQWFERYPEERGGDLAARLRDKNNRNHTGALYELLLHEFLTQRGFTFGVHQPLGPGNVDFGVIDPAHFYIEVATVFYNPAMEAGERRIRQQVAVLDEIRDPDFMLGVYFHDWLPPDNKPHRAKDLVVARLATVRRGEARPQERFGLGAIDMHLIPLREPSPGEFVGTYGGPIRTGGGSREARRAVGKKIRRYSAVKEVGVPFVVALCAGESTFIRSDDIDWELFGYGSGVPRVAAQGADGVGAYWRIPTERAQSRSHTMSIINAFDIPNPTMSSRCTQRRKHEGKALASPRTCCYTSRVLRVEQATTASVFLIGI